VQVTRPRDLYRRGDGDMALCGRVNTGVVAQMQHEAEAAAGSLMLANHCLRAFDRFADRYGIAADEARVLLLDTGVRL
jgi:hypothetical protein